MQKRPKMKNSPKLKKWPKNCKKCKKLQKIKFIRGHPYDVQWPKNWWNPPKMKKNGPKHEKWPKMGQKAKKMAYFLNPSVKNFDFLTKSFIYIFLICFGTFFPVAKNLGQKWFGGAQWSRRGVLGKKIKNLFCTFVGQFRPILKWKMWYKVPLRRFVHFIGV